MNITIYTIIYNEERILPFFLDYYSQFASRIIIYDNESTDRSVEIAKSYPRVKGIYSVKTNNRLDDSMYVKIKGSCWKNDPSDYVMLVDADELIYHDTGVVDYLQRTKYPVYQPIGYNMISDFFPIYGKPITEQIKQGVYDRMYNKPIIFDPKIINRVQYDLGVHSGSFFKDDEIVYPTISELKMLHYKNLGFDYRINRHKMFSKRMSDFNNTTGAGIHYTWDEEKQRQEFNSIFRESRTII